MVGQSWFHNLWPSWKKHEFDCGKAHVSVLAFEAVSLMTKLLRLWQSLTDKQVAWLRKEITDSAGIKNLVSENDNYIGMLICAEMMETLVQVAKAVARLSKKCNNPLLKRFEQAFNDLMKIGADTYGWQFSSKKMERKVKKMERFIVVNANLYQEMETLADLERTLKRLKRNDNADSITLVEYEKKAAWKWQEVKHLREISLWTRTYDYTVLLLARSLFTVYARIGHVFGIADVGVDDARITDVNISQCSHSTAFAQSSVYPFENCDPALPSGASGKYISLSGPLPISYNMGDFPLTPLSGLLPGKHNGFGFYSGPLGRLTTKSGPVSRITKSAFRFLQLRNKSQDEKDKIPQQKHSWLTASGPFTVTGCLMGRTSSSTNNCYSNSGDGFSGDLDGTEDGVKPHVDGNKGPGSQFVDACRSKLLNPPPETLGASALALHYANVIAFIEKLVASPHSIGNDVRDNLYNMLPASITASLRAKLKPYAKSLTMAYDTTLVSEWNEAMSEMLEWLAPLAHNMIRWQSLRSFEHRSLVSKTNVLLVQTLYFANQEKTEAVITELLVGLNYIWRFGRGINTNSPVESSSGRMFDECLD